MSALLWIVGCALGCEDGSWRAVVHRATIIQPVDATEIGGGFRLVPGDGSVLDLSQSRPARWLTRDTGSVWSVVLSLPAHLDPAGEIALEGRTAVARVASQDVVFLARRAHGTVAWTLTGGSHLEGSLEASFDEPERDLMKLGVLRLSRRFQAEVQP